MALLQGGTTVFGTGTIQGILYVGGIVTTATIQSTSTFSGSIVVSGGIGLSGNINAGGVVTATNLYVGIWPVSTGTTSGSSNITGTNNSFLITNQTQSVSTTTGALVVSGGVGISGNLYVYGGITATQLTIAYTTITQSLITSPDIFTITNTTPTTSPTTGALVVSGGAGVGGGLFVGGVATATNMYIGIWPVSTSTSGGSAASASTATTATNLAGGASGSIPIQSAAGQTAFIPIGTAGYILSSNGTTATWISTGTLAASNTLFAGTYSASLNSITGAFNIPNQLVSNTGTGSVTIIASPAAGSASTWTFGVTGGLTFPDNTVQTTAYTSGGSTGTTSSFLITNTTPTTSPTTGALVVSGGVGVGGAAYYGGTVFGAVNGTGGTAFLASNGAYNNIALGMQATSGPANMAIRDLSTVSSIMYFDSSANSPAGGSFVFRSTNGYNQLFTINTTTVTVYPTTNSTSTNSAQALLVTGGVGIQGNLAVGGSIWVNGALVAGGGSGSAGTANTSTMIYTQAVNSNTTYYPTFVNANNNNTNTAQTLYTTSSFTINPSTGAVTHLSTVSSLSTTTGALVVAGGVGVGGNIVSGGYGRFNGAYDETASTTTVSLYLGVAGNAPVSPRVGFANSGTTWQIDNYNGNFRWYTPGISRMQLDTNGNLTIFSSSATNSSTTGALVVSGGVGVGGGLFVGGVSSFIGIISTGLSTFTNTLEILSNVGSVSGATTLSYTSGQTYYVTPSATWSIAFTNVPTNPANYSTILTVVVNQGSTAYTATSITINGSAVTPKWSNGTPWSGNANHTDVVSYGVLNLAGTFNVVAQYSTFA